MPISVLGKGMTTASMKQTLPAVRTRVGWVSLHGEPLSSTFEGRDGELASFAAWRDLLDDVGGTFDLVLCDAEAANSVPAELDAPVLAVADGAVPAAVPCIPPIALTGALDGLLSLARRAADRNAECASMRKLTDGIRTGDVLFGNTAVMRRLQGAVRRAADCDVTVLLEGAPGSGKSLTARIIHCKSKRAGTPPVAAEASQTTIESLAKAIEAASRSTLILENIDRLPAAAQALLVRHMKDRNAQSHGPRLIVTTSAHLPELVAKGAFREDLYYRLHAFPLTLPALRERMEDLHGIVNSLLEYGMRTSGRAVPGITPSALMLLESMQWPGNVAQLEAIVRRASLQAGGGQIDREHLQGEPSEHAPTIERRSEARSEEETEDSIRPFEEEEKLLLSRALRATKGNVRRAAQLLNIGRATLYRKIQQYQLRLQ